MTLVGIKVNGKDLTRDEAIKYYSTRVARLKRYIKKCESHIEERNLNEDIAFENKRIKIWKLENKKDKLIAEQRNIRSMAAWDAHQNKIAKVESEIEYWKSR